MAKKRNWNLFFRKNHRDIGYFIGGLLMSYAISGIALNHRNHWDPKEYTYQTKDVQFKLTDVKDKALLEKEVKTFLKDNHLFQEYRKHRIKDDELRIALNNGGVAINIKTGKGEIELTKKRPIIGQMASLHTSSNNFWIWYGDIYALLVIFMVISGLTLSKGKFSFKKRGWKLLVLGLLFPLIAILFII